MKSKNIDEPIHLSSIKSVLILRYDKIGDMIVTIPVIRALKGIKPSLSIGVLSSPSNSQMLENESSVDDIYILHNNLFKRFLELWCIRKSNYDIVLDFIFNRTTSSALLSRLLSPNGIIVGQGDIKYKFYFNKYLQLESNKMHMSARLSSFIEKTFAIAMPWKKLSFRLSHSMESKWFVAAYLKENNYEENSYVVLNISVGEEIRRPTSYQCKEIIDYVNDKMGVPCVILHMPYDYQKANNLILNSRIKSNSIFPSKGVAKLDEISVLIEKSRLVITPDTSIVHFAAAFDKPVIGLYTKIRIEKEWLPFSKKNVILAAEDGIFVKDIPIVTIKAAIDLIITI